MKKLVINPDKNAKLTMLNPGKALQDLVHSVLRIDGPEQFKPTVAKSDYINRLLQKVEYKVVAVSKYSGRELNTYEQAVAFFDEVGTAIYGSKFWIAKYLKGEIERSPNQVFGLTVKNPEDLPEIKNMLKDRLADLFEIDSNGIEVTTPADEPKELVIKSSKVRQKEAEEAAKKKAKATKTAAEEVLDEALKETTVPETQDKT